jgi:poly(hydroxyalkanoate) granule-associated protein
MKPVAPVTKYCMHLSQAEGGKVFETLVKEGMNLQKKTQGMAEDKISEVTGKMTAMAGTVSAKAGQNWDKLEAIFEQRTAKAMNKLGVPTAKDVDALVKRVDALAAAVAKLSKKGPGQGARPRRAPARLLPSPRLPWKQPRAKPRRPRPRPSARASRQPPPERCPGAADARRLMKQRAPGALFCRLGTAAMSTRQARPWQVRQVPRPHRPGAGRRWPAGRHLRDRRAVRAGRGVAGWT